MAQSSVSSIIERISAEGGLYSNVELGSRERLITLGEELIAALEIPSEFIQRSFWAEPAKSAHCRLAVDAKLFENLKDAGSAGISANVLAEKTGIDAVLLQRVMRHLAAMKVIYFANGKWHGTNLSNGLSEQKYQDSISFCYDVARPSFNGFPEFFKRTGYKNPISLADGPFQSAHNTRLPFFDWLVDTPPHFAHFGSFMSAYRAGKSNWYDPGFYPVSERLIEGFDSNSSNVLLVDIGGGRGHDLELFAAVHASHPGKLVLQDLDSVIASLEISENTPFEAQAHDFFTAQPVTAARAYSLHSILHDWDDKNGVRILNSLKPALKVGYSRVLLNEIVVLEDNPCLAATSMDMMMLAHFAVRERTELDWRALLEQAGFNILKIYTYPGVAESVIEAELIQ